MESEVNFRRIYDDYFLHIYRFVLFNVNSKELTEDLTQEIFIKVYLNRDKLDQVESIHSWVLRIARNHLNDHYRKVRFKKYLYKNEFKEHDLSEFPIDVTILEKEAVMEIYSALGKLKKDYKEVIILRKINDCSIKETSTILGWSEDKVKSKLSRGLKKLKLGLSKGEEPYYERKGI